MILHRERANKVFGKRSARLLKFFITARLPQRSGVAGRRRHARLRYVRVINNVLPTTASSTQVRYVNTKFCFINHVLLSIVDLFMCSLVVYMFRLCSYDMVMLVNLGFMLMKLLLPSMLENCMLEFNLVMFNLVRNLIMILPIIPTVCTL